MIKMAIVMTAFSLLCAPGAGRADDAGQDRPPNAEFYGTVEAMPPDGFLGKWVVNGREIVVIRSTELDQKHGVAAVGAYVKVEGNFSGSRFVAEELEVERSTSQSHMNLAGQHNCRFIGIVEKMPTDGHEGLWFVDGRRVEVGKATLIDERTGKASTGCRAEVKGIRAGGSVKALEIKIADGL